MAKIIELISIANNFISERDWWQFHDPKSDAMCIMVEVGELSELYIENDQATALTIKDIAKEIADILLVTIAFSLLTKNDIVDSVSTVIGHNYDRENISYNEITNLILDNLDKFEINKLATQQQIILSLVAEASKLGDIFIWNTKEESFIRAQAKRKFISIHIASIIAYIVYLSYLVKINLPQEFIQKIQYNTIKYPLESASGIDYLKRKDEFRGRN